MPSSSKNIKIGYVAKYFKLLNIDNNLISLDNIKKTNGFALAFICNHCPYVKDIISRLVKDFKYLQTMKVGVSTIMSNDTDAYPEDSFENMKLFAEKNDFSFPYLYDETQSVAKDYDAACTPDFFCFDKNNKLFYRGRLDNCKYKEHRNDRNTALINAFIENINNGVVLNNQINSIGCSIKWKPQ